MLKNKSEILLAVKLGYGIMMRKVSDDFFMV